MKGIILAGGSGSRLHPLTKVTNKHLLPIYNQPMIYYPLFKLIECGIKEVMIVSSRDHIGSFLELLGGGNEFNISINYEIQEEAGGIAQALSLCERWSAREPIIVILGDNIIGDNLCNAAKKFKNGAHIFFKEVEHPERFGVGIFVNHQLRDIIEKPNPSPSPLAVIGAYIYDHRVYRFIEKLKPSDRGELEITDVNVRYLKMNELYHTTLEGFWSDAGTFDSLMSASIHMYELNCAAQRRVNNLFTPTS